MTLSGVTFRRMADATSRMECLPLGIAFSHQALALVRTLRRFTEDNDPHGEHDFGSFDHDGERIFWKIDYYDAACEFGSEDPAEPAKTTRVLTIMLAEEY